MRCYTEYFLEFSSCLFMTIKLAQDIATIVQRAGVVGPQCQRPVVARQRLIETTQLPQRTAAVVERPGVVGPQRQRPVVARQRLVEAPQLKQHKATVAQS